MSASTQTKLPEENDFIRVSYTTDHGEEKTADGIVTDVEDENPAGRDLDLVIKADEPGDNTELILTFGREEDDGEHTEFSYVSRQSPFGSGPVELGTEVEYEIL